MKTIKYCSMILIILVFAYLPELIFGQDGIIGTWSFVSEMGSMTMKIDESVLEIDGESYSYDVHDNLLLINEYGTVTTYSYLLEGDQLAIEFPDGTWVLFTRVSGMPVKQQSPEQPERTGQTSSQSKAWQLKGVLCSWSGSSNDYSSYSRTRKLAFDGQGNFQFGSEASFSGDAGLAYSGNPNVETGTYEVAAKTVTLRYRSGESYQFEINMRQDNGMITELMYNGTLYATGLCE